MARRRDGLHDRVRGFDRTADAYERGRPGYPADAVHHLTAALALGPDSRVADVAAGTGKLTRELVPRAGWVLAVEPVAGMRTQLRLQVAAATVVAARAEALPFRDTSLDAVTVAQAFHWFDGHQALEEFARVLPVGGGLAVVWNERDESAPIQADLSAVVNPYRGDTPRYRRDRWREPFETSSRFARLRSASFPWQVTMDEQQLVDRIVSTSFIAMLPPAVRDDVAARTREVFERHARGGATVALPSIAWIHATRRRD